MSPWLDFAAYAISTLPIFAAWWLERRAHRETRAALDAQRATVAAAAVLYGEARMREAARMVAMREKPEGEE